MGSDRQLGWKKRLFRNVLGLLGVLIVVAILSALTLPYWMGWALKAFAPEELVSFQSYETKGYGRFEVKDLRLDIPGLSLNLDSLSAPTPLTWTYRALISGFDAKVVEIKTLNVVQEFSGAQSPTSNDGSLPKDFWEMVDQLEAPLGLANLWLPSARIEKINIEFKGYKGEISDFDWQAGDLSFQAAYSERLQTSVDLKLSLLEEGLDLFIQVPSESIAWDIDLTFDDQTATASSRFSIQDNILLVEASFGPGSWLPVKANWQAESWEIDTTDYGIQMPYTDYRFDIQGLWENDAFSNSAKGIASAQSGQHQWSFPDIEFDSELEGNLGQVRAKVLNLKSPGLDVAIQEPVSYDIETKQMQGDFRFDIDFDLSVFKWEALSGLLEGQLVLYSGTEGDLLGGFALSGSQIVFHDYEVPSLNIDCELDWPYLKINDFNASLNGNSSFGASGEVDFAERYSRNLEISGNLDKAFLDLLVPQDLQMDQLQFEIVASGPWLQTAHSGKLSFSRFENQNFKPLSGELSWNGEYSSLDRLDLKASNDRAVVSLQASGELADGETEIELQNLGIELDNANLVSLEDPVSLKVISQDADTIIEMSDLHLVGPGGEVRLEGVANYPRSAEVSAYFKNLDTGNWHDPWIKDPASTAEIREARFDVAWNEGPIVAKGALDAWIDYQGKAVFAKGGLELGEASVRLDEFDVTDANGPLIQLDGEVPYALSSEYPGWVISNKEGSISLNLKSSKSQTIAQLLGEILPYDLNELSVEAALEGTLAHPKGNLTLNLDTKEGEGEHGQPAARMSLDAHIDGSRLELNSAALRLLEQSFAASGSIELPAEALALLSFGSPDVNWTSTQIDFSISESSLAPLAYFAPQLLRADGTIEGEIEGSLTGGLSGFLSIEGANTRPIFPFGSLREISSRFSLDGYLAKLESFSGNIGLEPINVTGSVDFSKLAEPRFEMNVSGENLPLLRSEGILLRSDLDLAITKDSKEPTIVSGELNLQESLFLMNLSALTAGGGGGGQSAESRPPYFAVDIPPLDDWRLDIALKGDRFLNLQTPAATGTLSIDKKLVGTLGEPYLQGQARYDDGDLLFPFATFVIEQGLVEIRVDDPYTPMLNINGQSRRFGYDLSIDITGSAFDPQVRFTSSPPLTSEQILMMVMAGENPEGMFNYSVSQRASKVGTYLAKGLFSSSGSGGGIGSRFSLSSGENLSRQGKETLDVEFKLDEQFQLLGEYDEYDAWNAGIRWKAIRRKVFKEEETSE